MICDNNNFKMKLDYKKIHIGSLIRKEVEANNIESSHICNFMNCKENEIQDMYEAVSLPSNILLQWCKLLEYDFFRIYSQHLILFSAKNSSIASSQENKISLPTFRKNLYTTEIIKFILELIRTGKKTNAQIIEEYKIPKTTLLKWIDKY